MLSSGAGWLINYKPTSNSDKGKHLLYLHAMSIVNLPFPLFKRPLRNTHRMEKPTEGFELPWLRILRSLYVDNNRKPKAV